MAEKYVILENTRILTKEFPRYFVNNTKHVCKKTNNQVANYIIDKIDSFDVKTLFNIYEFTNYESLKEITFYKILDNQEEDFINDLYKYKYDVYSIFKIIDASKVKYIRTNYKKFDIARLLFVLWIFKDKLDIEILNHICGNIDKNVNDLLNILNNCQKQENIYEHVKIFTINNFDKVNKSDLLEIVSILNITQEYNEYIIKNLDKCDSKFLIKILTQLNDKKINSDVTTYILSNLDKFNGDELYQFMINYHYDNNFNDKIREYYLNNLNKYSGENLKLFLKIGNNKKYTINIADHIIDNLIDYHDMHYDDLLKIMNDCDDKNIYTKLVNKLSDDHHFLKKSDFNFVQLMYDYKHIYEEKVIGHILNNSKLSTYNDVDFLYRYIEINNYTVCFADLYERISRYISNRGPSFIKDQQGIAFNTHLMCISQKITNDEKIEALYGPTIEKIKNIDDFNSYVNNFNIKPNIKLVEKISRFNSSLSLKILKDYNIKPNITCLISTLDRNRSSMKKVLYESYIEKNGQGIVYYDEEEKLLKDFQSLSDFIRLRREHLPSLRKILRNVSPDFSIIEDVCKPYNHANEEIFFAMIGLMKNHKEISIVNKNLEINVDTHKFINKKITYCNKFIGTRKKFITNLIKENMLDGKYIKLTDDLASLLQTKNKYIELHDLDKLLAVILY